MKVKLKLWINIGKLLCLLCETFGGLLCLLFPISHNDFVTDEVLEVNSLKLCGKSVHDICSTLCQMSGTLTFVVIPASSPVSHCPEEEESSHPVVSRDQTISMSRGANFAKVEAIRRIIRQLCLINFSAFLPPLLSSLQ